MSGADETVGLAGLVYDVRAMQALLERIARRQRTQTMVLQVLLGLGIGLTLAAMYVVGWINELRAMRVLP
jgi:hypothetical protein